MQWLIFGGGIGAGLVLMVIFIWIIGRKSDEPKSIPLNPELLRFWEISIKQKQEELIILRQISEKLK